MAAFAIWVAYGFLLRRRQGRWLALAQGLSPRKVWSRSLGWLLGGSGIALGLLVAVGAGGGVRDGRLVPWGMLVSVIAGLVFVHGQTVAAVIILTGTVTKRTTDPSGTSES